MMELAPYLRCRNEIKRKREKEVYLDEKEKYPHLVIQKIKCSCSNHG